MFLFLSGQPPFYDDDLFQLYEKIKRCDYSFENEVWSKSISFEAKDLIASLLVVEPSERISMDAIKAHPWVTRDVSLFKKSSSTSVTLGEMR